MKKLTILGAFLWLCMGCEAILIEDISNKTVVVLAPTENSQVAAGTVSFSWKQLDDASSYTIQVATPDFTNATQILLNTNSSENSSSVVLSSGNYQWRVRASNSEYSTEYTTTNFTVN
jgi:type III secretory pathway lipoprotein EscJ